MVVMCQEVFGGFGHGHQYHGYPISVVNPLYRYLRLWPEVDWQRSEDPVRFVNSVTGLVSLIIVTNWH